MPLENQEVIQGDPVKFLCQVVTSPDEIDKVHIRWKFNDVLIKASSSNRFKILEEGETLSIRNAQKTEEGDYTCIASMRGMKARSTARLMVKSMYMYRCTIPDTGGRHGHDRMIVGFTTTYGIGAYHH